MGRAEPGSDGAERAAAKDSEAPRQHDDSLDETLPSGEHPGAHGVIRFDPASDSGGDRSDRGMDSVTRAVLNPAAGTPTRFPVVALTVPATAPADRSGARAADPLEVSPGVQLGRYVVQEQLGSGTMGLVLAAIDPSLDRKVALKVVRPDQIGGSTSGRQRLLREAQAMARLAHPNVVTVYEVGTVSDHVFVAMEHIDGSTLDVWLKAEKRSLREIVEAFTGAARGLAAAHAAGIVHRDFKPANVLVSADGRVRVADFGLATTPVAQAEPAPREIVIPSSQTISITQTGALLGTPAYMSPEQHMARPTDARADQFSFCVAMYEAIYGQLPFSGDGYLAYAHSVTEGKVREAPRGSRVPNRVRRVLLRGLLTDPAHRYPSMRALLADLDRAMSARRRNLALAGAGALGVGALAFALFGPAGADRDPCAAADQPASSLWDAPARGKVEAAFRGAGTPAAAAALDHIDRALTARVGAIRAMRREACVATAVRHQESAVLFDRRMQCLDRRGEEIRALTSVMAASPDRTAVSKAVEAAVSLPSVDACADRDALLAAVPLPDDRKVRARVAELEKRLERGKALDKAGKLAEALALVDTVVADAERVPYPPLRARAHFALASVENSLGDYAKAETELRSTALLAAAARDDELVARIWLLLYKTIGFDKAIPDKAAQVEPAVAAAVERAGGNHELRGNLDSVRGIIEMRAGEYAASVEHLESALRHLEAALGRESSRVADVLQAEGQSLEGVGKFDQARAALEEARGIRVKLLGPEHQNVAMSEKALGVLYDTMGKPAEALPHFQRAVDIFERVLPPDHPNLANALSSLGVVLDNVDRSREALPYHLRAVAILEKRGKDAEVALSYAVSNLGVSYMEQERYADAFHAYERALALKDKLLGPDHPTVGHTLCSMGVAARRSGDLERAEQLCRRALAILQKKLGPEHPECAPPMGSLAETLLLRHRAAEALPLIAKARAIAEKDGEQETAAYGETLFLHGRVLAAVGRAPEGLALMGRGLEVMKKLGDKKKNIADAERLLDQARNRRR